MVLALAGGVASAGLVVSEVGVANGFGVAVAADGSFDSFDIELGMPPGDGTDEWLVGTSVHHQFAPFSGNITAATLTLGSGGWGFLDPAGSASPATVFIQSGVDQLEIGMLSLGENGDVNVSATDVFTLTSDALALLASGDVQVRIVPVFGLHATGTDPEDDYGVLDFSRLTITTDAGGTSQVPEPTTWALTALALAGLAASRRRQAR